MDLVSVGRDYQENKQHLGLHKHHKEGCGTGGFESSLPGSLGQLILGFH